MKDLILFPFNGNAKEAIAVVEAINRERKRWNILGFIDDEPSTRGKFFCNYPVLGGREQLEKFPFASLIAVPGRAENFLQRKKIIDSLCQVKERFASLVHPASNISSDTKMGYNTLIMAGIATTANVTIGNHCAILPNTVLSHDVTVGDYCLIGSNVSISGHVIIEPLCYVGTGSKLIQEIRIGKGTLIGMGSVVLKSTEPNVIVAGNPARVLRSNIP